jgi:hypothetical protein
MTALVSDLPTNGHTRADIEDRLVGDPLTSGYRPTLPLWSLWTADTVPQFYLLRDIELMMIHPIVVNVLRYFKGGIAGVEFDIQCEDQMVAQFLQEQCTRFWDRGLQKIQGGYEYGWIAAENLYVTNRAGQLEWEDCMQFSPRDVYLLTHNSIPVGVRVKQIRVPWANEEPSLVPGKGIVDLWLASRDVPAKGLWYAHQPRYSQFYGLSQLLGAWKPWRRLAWKDAAETVIDGGIYRFAYAGPVVGYPDEDYQANVIGVPATTLDSQGRPRRYARDMARQMAEYYKTGAGVGIPSGHYPPEMGGGPKWTFDLPTSTLNVSGLIEYAKYLQEQIAYGIGVPPELLQASETGSGYSGRAIPLEGFLMTQQQIADRILALFLNQVLKPLVRWNFGDVPFVVKCKNLMASKRQAQMGEQQGQPGAPGEARQPGQAPSPELPTGEMPEEPYDPNWKPYYNQKTKQSGWISDRGRVVYADQPPGTEQTGFSLEQVKGKIDRLARQILASGKVA